jgi:hypothetical protein
MYYTLYAIHYIPLKTIAKAIDLPVVPFIVFASTVTKVPPNFNPLVPSWFAILMLGAVRVRVVPALIPKAPSPVA